MVGGFRTFKEFYTLQVLPHWTHQLTNIFQIEHSLASEHLEFSGQSDGWINRLFLFAEQTFS